MFYMKDREKSDEEFARMYESFEKETLEDIVKKNNFSKNELDNTLHHLIINREKVLDFELNYIDEEAKNRVKHIDDVKKQKLLEEIRCFKEMISLQKHLNELRGK